MGSTSASRRHRPTRLLRVLAMTAVGIAGIWSITATSVPGEPFRSTGESFLLVYTDADTAGTRTRMSKTGVDWRDIGLEGRFPPPLVAENMFGASVPLSYAQLADSRWLFASLVDNRLVLQVMDNDRPSGPNLAPDHPLATAVTGWPAVTVFQDNVLLAWRRGIGPRHELVTAVGRVQEGGIAFDEPVVFKRNTLQAAGDSFLAVGPTFKDGVVANPALSHGAYGQFYMLVVRETWEDVQAQRTGQTIAPRYRAVVYQSEDGVDWGWPSIAQDEFPVGPGSRVAIAGFTDSTAIIATVSGPEGEAGTATVMRNCYGGLWFELDAKAVFGGTPMVRPFALTGIGEPALPKPNEYYVCD